MSSKNVKIENLSKIYPNHSGNEKTVVAVDHISLDIREGEFVTLLGPSGCGKTTTLRMIAGFEMPDTGAICLGDEKINHLTPDKRDTAMVFQSYALFPNYNVFDNIAYGLKIKKIPKNEIERRVNAMIDLVGLKGMEKRHTNQLSGGQQQRVALARALVMEPGALLFDEPLSNLDAKLRVQMRTEIRKLQQKLGITAIYVTHDQAEAMSLSDRIIIMKDGRIAQADTPKEIYYHPRNAFVANFIGTANLIDATVTAYREGRVDVLVAGTELKNVESAIECKPGEMISLVLRPEACALADEGTFPVIVQLSTFMGSYQYYEVLLGDTVISVQETNPKGNKEYSVGEQAMLCADPSNFYAIAKELPSEE